MNQLLECRSNLIDQLESTADEFRSACLAVSDPLKSVDEGSWNTHQLAAHTRDVEKLVYGMRIRRTAEEDNPEFLEFDPDNWISYIYTIDEPLTSILDELSASVKETISFLRELSPEAWIRESSHETFGSGFTLQTWVERGLAHIGEHLESVKKEA